MIELEQICKVYQNGETPLHALSNVALHVEEGEFVSIIGKSGSGKTTLLNILGCMDTPTSGKYLFEGKDLTQFSYNALADFRNRRIGFVFQSFCLINDLSVQENVEMPMGYAGKSKKQRRERSGSLLEAVGIYDKRRGYPSQLSGGQQQRVAIARALANDPAIILADEPTGNLDSATSEQILALFQEINEKGKTILMITHNLDLASRAGRRIHLSDGRIDVGEQGPGVQKPDDGADLKRTLAPPRP